jgi:hypothetical protein
MLGGNGDNIGDALVQPIPGGWLHSAITLRGQSLDLGMWPG